MAGCTRTVPASAELMRLYSDYLHREYGALDSDYVFVNHFAVNRADEDERLEVGARAA